MSPAIVAVVLWFRSAAGALADETHEALYRLIQASRLNRWAAAVTAVSMLLSVVATLMSAAELSQQLTGIL